MPRIWLVADSETIDIRVVKARLMSFAKRTTLNLVVRSASPTRLGRLPIAEEDVVVVCQHATSSKLPADAPTLANSRRVLPVVETQNAAKVLRPYLSDRNALVADGYASPDSFHAALVGEVLTLLLLHWHQPRVFISYQRQVTVAAARQLTTALLSRGFEVFLDERSLRPGADFNQEIGYALNDAELVILLATRSVVLSDWVMKEVTFANNAKIGLIAISCDGKLHPDLRTLLDSPQIFSLTSPVSTRTDLFSASDLELLLVRLFEVRVASIVRRIENLMPIAVDMLERRHPGKQAREGKSLGRLQVPGVPGFTEVLPFRPNPEVLFRLRCEAFAPVEPVVVVHPENLPDDPRVLAMRWLCLPVEQKMELMDVETLWV